MKRGRSALCDQTPVRCRAAYAEVKASFDKSNADLTREAKP